ncbi:hypothetical protein SNOG_01342 [Parastagonospora nodorum SN15]|uniref:Uncharacterized protein n=1 Tax=Phaeosphaeria nodorum (strain SN15 / ATCC MYA-4574 / FGSC 10173) TaxID=321614 RepID=Q0V3S2_PHANO|nr:hypothetical protein SNOG_01342 [Parastagonospora nodorum SN15]EAT90991.1 hypothetical protein SNOG_01342 [Parastagonospora nodorum SN15]
MASPRAVSSEVQGEEYIKPFLSSMSEDPHYKQQ